MPRRCRIGQALGLAQLSPPGLSSHVWTASWYPHSSKAGSLGDNPPFPWDEDENQDARKGETYERDDFPGNRVASGSPEQEVQEEAPDQLLTGRRSGRSLPALSSCRLQVPGREGGTPEQLREAAEHGLHLHLGSIISKGRDEGRVGTRRL